MTTDPIMVTGHTGFLGRAVGAVLDQHGRDWFGAARSVGIDLELPGALNDSPQASAVVHLAGRVAVLDSWQRPADFHRTNYLSTLEGLEYARRCGAHFIYVSSYMYGAAQVEVIDESQPVDVLSPYAASKRQGEIIAETYARLHGLDVTILRPFNVFGPGQPTHQLMPYVIDQAVASDTISVADLAPRRDWLWSGDFALAVLAVLDQRPSGLNVFNLGTGVGISVQDVIDAVLAQTGPRRVICRNEARRNEILSAVCDNRKFRDAFGWAPRTSLAEGIRILLDQTDAQPVPRSSTTG